MALHEAAYLGHEEVIQLLLDYGAAVHPRCKSNETPRDIAMRMNHFGCVQLFDLYSNRHCDNCPPRNQWLHDNLTDREETNKILQEAAMMNGIFLVRKTNRKKNAYVLETVFNSRVFHFYFKINYNKIFYHIDDGPCFPTLEHIIGYYMKQSDGLPTKLISLVPSIVKEYTGLNDIISKNNTRHFNKYY